MKILHVLETLSPRYSAPVSVLLALVAAQRGATHQLILIPKLISRRTIKRLLEEAGFRVVHASGVGRVPYLWKSMVVVARK